MPMDWCNEFGCKELGNEEYFDFIRAEAERLKAPRCSFPAYHGQACTCGYAAIMWRAERFARLKRAARFVNLYRTCEGITARYDDNFEVLRGLELTPPELDGFPLYVRALWFRN